MELIDSIHDLKALQISAEFRHWITPAEPEHRTLEKLYTSLQDDIDNLVECSLGSGLIHPGAFSSRRIDINLDQDIATQIANCLSLLRRTASVLSKDEEIQDLVYDLMNLLNKINYLLSLS